MGSSSCDTRRNDVAITPPSTSYARYRHKRSVKPSHEFLHCLTMWILSIFGVIQIC